MLSQILPAEAFGYLLITIRMVAMVMTYPGIGDNTIPRKLRVTFAAATSVVVYLSVREAIPPMPASVWGLTMLAFRELIIGVMMGTVTRFILTAAHVAGSVISMQTGLAAAQSFDPAQGGQSAIVASFMTVMAITLIFVMDIHHLMIKGLVHSYSSFPIGEVIPFVDFARVATHYVSSSFKLGIALASPFIAYALIFNLSLGLIARMMPQFQVFFIGMPINIYLGFTLMMLLLPSMVSLLLSKMMAFLMEILG